MNDVLQKTHLANTRLAEEAWAHVKKVGLMSKDNYGHCCYDGIGCPFSVAVKPECRILADAKSSDGNIPHASCMLKKHKDWLFEWAHECTPSFALSMQKDCHDKYTSDNSDDFVMFFAKEFQILCEDSEVPVPADLEAYLGEHS